jgi:two-component system response regulator
MLPANCYVLLAEDDEDDVLFFREEFSHHCPSVEILHFTDGKEVIDFLAGCPLESEPALLLLDYKMPTISAIEVLDFLQSQERYRTMKKLVWSTSSRLDERDRCLSLGADSFLRKPGMETEWKEIGLKIATHLKTGTAER